MRDFIHKHRLLRQSTFKHYLYYLHLITLFTHTRKNIHTPYYPEFPRIYSIFSPPRNKIPEPLPMKNPPSPFTLFFSASVEHWQCCCVVFYTSYVERSGMRLRERSSIGASISFLPRPLSPLIAISTLFSKANRILVRTWLTT